MRGYLVLRGDLGTDGQGWLDWQGTNGPAHAQTPNLYRPADRSWCVATEIDFAWTLVACSRATAGVLTAHPALEAWAIDGGASVLITGDRLNR